MLWLSLFVFFCFRFFIFLLLFCWFLAPLRISHDRPIILVRVRNAKRNQTRRTKIEYLKTRDLLGGLFFHLIATVVVAHLLTCCCKQICKIRDTLRFALSWHWRHNLATATATAACYSRKLLRLWRRWNTKVGKKRCV